MLEKGLVDRETLDELIDFYQNEVGPRNGAKVIAKAWSDPEYKQWLLSDATSAIASLGFSGRQGENMVAVKTPKKFITWWYAHFVLAIQFLSWITTNMV